MKQITKEIKDIRDHLHLYLGREAEVINKPDGLAITDHPQIVTIDGTVVDCSSMMYESIKPILRKLSSMTEEEAAQVNALGSAGWRIINPDPEVPTNIHLGVVHRQAAEVAYLLSKGFDLFGLIESGLALDKENK